MKMKGTTNLTNLTNGRRLDILIWAENDLAYFWFLAKNFAVSRLRPEAPESLEL